MKKRFLVTKNQLVTGLFVFISRLGLLPANVNPLGSFGFFGNPVLFITSIIVFDLFVKGIYEGFWLTYLGFACYPIIGWLTKNSTKKQVIGLPLASFLFFLISNLGVWLYWYDHTWNNLLLCYTLAVPFYARTLFGDIFFGYSYLIYREFLVKKSFNFSSYKLFSSLR